MLHSVQQFGKELGRDLVRGWESLTDGWRELLSRSAGALTQFGRKGSGKGELIPADAPSWSLLAGDVVDNGHEVVVRIEMPGIDKADCEIFVDGNTLFVRARNVLTALTSAVRITCGSARMAFSSGQFRCRLPCTPTRRTLDSKTACLWFGYPRRATLLRCAYKCPSKGRVP